MAVFRTPFELQMESDRDIRGDYWSAPARPSGLVIVCHGYRAHKDALMYPYMAERLAGAGFDVLNVNFSFNGVGPDMVYYSEPDKFAANTYSKEIEDLLFLADAVRQGRKELPVSDRFAGRGAVPVFAVGHSRGGFTAYISAIETPDRFAGIVAWNGHFDDLEAIFTRVAVADMRETGSGRYGGKKNGMLLDAELLHDLDRNAERFDVYGRASEAAVPMLIVQGEEDFVFIRKASAKLAKKSSLIERIVVPGANHTFGAVHPFEGTTPPLEEAIAATVAFMTAVIHNPIEKEFER